MRPSSRQRRLYSTSLATLCSRQNAVRGSALPVVPVTTLDYPGRDRRPTAVAESRRVAVPDLEPVASAPRDFRAEIERAWRILGRLNALPAGDFDAMRALLGELTGHALDPSVRVHPPFHSDGGRNLRIGRNLFVNPRPSTGRPTRSHACPGWKAACPRVNECQIGRTECPRH